ncbi:hypothetical protein Pla163_20690 [Planctomycetes bacterium Pla163]|uniref:Uncharacterized protein n=1 Tax=Rohdeia mirabilis TaxID=2528008 RepID=A0A518D0F5_9BACT|nr:hypothetical protein Pla163_20690 [Planctomycetes bacterium Pla163]
MNKNSTPLVIVLVVLALALGGVLAWVTAPNGETADVDAGDSKTEVAARVDQRITPPGDLEIPLSERGVETTLERRWGPELAGEIENLPAADVNGRPLYHSKTVVVSMDQDGNPRYVRPSWSPNDPSKLEIAKKEVDRSEFGQIPGPTVDLKSPQAQKFMAEQKQRSAQAKQLQKWANEQIKAGKDLDEAGLPKLPKNLDGFLSKLEQAEKKNKKGGGKKQKDGADDAPKNLPKTAPASGAQGGGKKKQD